MGILENINKKMKFYTFLIRKLKFWIQKSKYSDFYWHDSDSYNLDYE